MPSRRTYLTTLVAASLAGCVADSPTTGTDGPADDATVTGTASRPALRVETAAVQYSYRHIQNVDWNAIQPADGQFVFVTIDTSDVEPIPGREAFTLVADGASHDAADIADRNPVSLDVPGNAYWPEEYGETRGWLGFDVPARLDSEPSLRLDGENGTWEWELDTAKATAPPPEWEWTASAPPTVAPGTTFDITIVAENVGDGPGTFRGAVNFSYPFYHPKGFDIELESGASGEATVSAEVDDAEPGRELSYGVRTATGTSTVTTTVESASTATERTD